LGAGSRELDRLGTPRHDEYWLYRDTFFELLPPPGPPSTVAAARARLARDLAGRGHRVTGIDASPTLLAAATQAHADGSYVLADAADLPFRDGSFDLVVACNSLMDIQDMLAAVREAARVLKPGGRFCACVTHPVADAGRFAARDADAPFVIVGSYLGRRRYEATFERNGLRMTFRGWTHALEDYSRALEDAGLLIRALREPPLPADEVVRDPPEHRWRRLPSFLMLRALRPPEPASEGKERPSACT
jgi:SAM-dependent methyltransferase